MSQKKHIKVTYSTLASPDPLLHQYFDEAVVEAKAGFGKTFLNAGNREWAGRMHDDLLDAVAWTVSAGAEQHISRRHALLGRCHRCDREWTVGPEPVGVG